MPSQLTLRHRSSVFEGQYRLEVQVVSAVDLGTAIFLFQQIPNWHGSAHEAQPLGVCSPSDMVDVPVDTPTPGVQWPLFRRDRIDILVNSTVSLADVLAAIEAAASRLCRATDALAQMSEWQEMEIT